MAKKLPHVLLIPALGLLPLTQALAAPLSDHHPINPGPPPHVAERSMPERSFFAQMQNIAGKETVQLPIELNQAFKDQQANKFSVITLVDKNAKPLRDAAGHKQRLMLLTKARSDLIAALLKANGRLKEFDLYPVVDKNGHDTGLFASKRIVKAPGNQLTLLFSGPHAEQDAESFFTVTPKSMLQSENIYLLAASSEELASQLQVETIQEMVNAQQGMNNTLSQKYSQQITDISNYISVKTQDNHKSSAPVEIGAITSLAVIVAGAAIVATG